MSTKVTLRLAQAADLARIQTITNAAYTKYLPRLGRQPQPMTADYLPMLAAQQIWLAEQDGIAVGLIVLQPATDHLLIYSVAVAPAHQGTGVGRQLLLWAEQEAVRQGYPVVQLYTNEKMTENIALYGRIGYQEVKRVLVNSYQVVYMEKTLPATQHEEKA